MTSKTVDTAGLWNLVCPECGLCLAQGETVVLADTAGGYTRLWHPACYERYTARLEEMEEK